MPINLDTYNEEVKQWAAETSAGIKQKGAGYGITHRADSPSRGASLNRIRNRFNTDSGVINKIGIVLPRTLVYVHKGAGKGRGGVKGSRWIDRYGNQKKTNPKSFGKMGTAGRVAKPFINDVLDSEQGMDKLATIAATNLGDAVVNNLFIK